MSFKRPVSATTSRQLRQRPHTYSSLARLPAPDASALVDLSIVIPALREAANLRHLLPILRDKVVSLGINYEIVLVTEEKDDDTRRMAGLLGARVIIQDERGYGRALSCGLRAARGTYILSMDADLSHPPEFVRDLWNCRHAGDIIIASRYTPGGRAEMPLARQILSRVLNRAFSRGLSLAIKDMSSGYRLYRAQTVRPESLEGNDFDVLQEILVRAYAEGWSVAERPFHYRPRIHGASHARVFRFGLSYARRFWTLWKLRNSILCADYDARAYNSPIPLQRYWQRARFRHVMALIEGEGPVLDVGCGSSRIIEALPQGSVALDILMRKLRYARRYQTSLVCSSGCSLPFPDASFSCVLCSQVIEHVPKTSPILAELCRVLRPGGRLILGTPDYANWEWVVMEKLYNLFAPGAYADEHIAHYTRRELLDFFSARGYRHEATRYILRGELILAFRKPPA